MRRCIVRCWMLSGSTCTSCSVLLLASCAESPQTQDQPHLQSKWRPITDLAFLLDVIPHCSPLVKSTSVPCARHKGCYCVRCFPQHLSSMTAEELYSQAVALLAKFVQGPKQGGEGAPARKLLQGAWSAACCWPAASLPPPELWSKQFRVKKTRASTNLCTARTRMLMSGEEATETTYLHAYYTG